PARRRLAGRLARGLPCRRSGRRLRSRLLRSRLLRSRLLRSRLLRRRLPGAAPRRRLPGGLLRRTAVRSGGGTRRCRLRPGGAAIRGAFRLERLEQRVCAALAEQLAHTLLLTRQCAVYAGSTE